MIVTIQQVTSGACMWCCQSSDEVLEVAFHDGLQGRLCRKDFWVALKPRGATPQPAPPERASDKPKSQSS